MRDARSPWSWSGNSYWGHMAWKTAAAGKTASNSPSVRMNFHVLLVLMSPRTMLRRFVLCFSVCVQERTFYFSVEKKKKKSFQAKHVWFMLPRTWICLDLGFNKTNCKACRKAARFCAYRTFFLFLFAGKFTLTSAAALNSLSPSLFDIRFAADIHPLGAPAASAVLPSLFLPPTSLGFLLALRTTSLLLLLLFSHLPLFLITLSLSLFSLPHPPGLRSWSHAHDSSSHMETFSLWMWGSFYCC